MRTRFFTYQNITRLYHAYHRIYILDVFNVIVFACIIFFFEYIICKLCFQLGLFLIATFKHSLNVCKFGDKQCTVICELILNTRVHNSILCYL